MKKMLVLASVLIILGGVIFTMSSCGNNWDFMTIFKGRMEEKVTNIDDSVSGIEILTDTADITLLTSEDEKCKVLAKDKKKINYSVTVDDGMLKISSKDERRWYERLFDFGKPILNVYLPKGEYSTLSIEESTGNVTIPSDFSFTSIDIDLSTGNTLLGASGAESVRINASTGDVKVENNSCGSLDIDVSTGTTTLNNVTCAGNINMKCSTGDAYIDNISYKSLTYVGDTADVKINNLKASENTAIERSTGHISIINAVCTGNLTTKTSTGKTEIMGVECADLSVTVSTGKAILSDINCATLTTAGDTGDVNLVNVIASGKFDIKRDTGDVDFDGCDAAEIYVKTDTGDVEGTLLTEKVFIVNTDTGRVNVPESTTGGKCKITTDTGNVKISFKK